MAILMEYLHTVLTKNIKFQQVKLNSLYYILLDREYIQKGGRILKHLPVFTSKYEKDPNCLISFIWKIWACWNISF